MKPNLMNSRRVDKRSASTKAATVDARCLSTLPVLHAKAFLPVILLSVIALNACTVGSDYVRPEPQMPQEWRSTTTQAPTGTLGKSDLLWWQGFNDPVLNQLIDEAISNNKDIQLARARVDQYLGALQTTRSAYFPQIGAAANASRTRSTEASAAPFPSSVANPSGMYAAQFNLAWEIDLFGRTRRATEAAQAQVQASEEDRRAVMLSVVAGVASGYIALRASDAKLAIAQATLKNYADTLHIFELRFKGGVISQLQLAQVQSQYQLAQTAIPGIEQQIAVQENLLSILLGRNPGDIPRGKPLNQLAMPPIPADLPSSLLQRRPDILSAEAQLVAANAQIGVARSLYFPTLSLTGALGTASNPLSSLFSGQAQAWNMAAGLPAPLATFGQIEGQVQSAEAVYEQAKIRYLQSAQTALREVNDALTGIDKTRQTLSAQQKRVLALQESAYFARLRFDNGLTSYLEVLNSEDDLFSAQLTAVDAQSAGFGEMINAYKAMGGGWVDMVDPVKESVGNTNSSPAGS
ncbi:MAG: efflux transporter outer membrane subunit [Halothiobacillaceae bacterium]|nr:efflux transporter outer membrane subunit [Halothiobacillaceae bacterium]